ncbi:unnamed protein product [Fraxinus pennsylvanica]|uniref:Uncharacterized protein n=1 Tax=Fraxinus pennsylvanica TaxID=56036 RepID=A0AAD2DZL5_9LAMI|nr:unnamed protein product [Fraxinus pennsylvanica]
MKKSYLAWILILSYAQILLPSLVLANPQKLEQENHSTSRKVDYDAHAHDKEFVAEREIIWTEKGRLGRGPYGSPKVNQRRPKKNAAALLYTPSLVISMTFFTLTIAFA